MIIHDEFNSEDSKIFMGLIDTGKFKLRDDLVLLEPINDQKLGRFELPWMHTDKDWHTTHAVGKVMLIGDGRYSAAGVKFPTEVAPGDIVFLSRAYMMRLSIVGKYFYLTEENHILGFMEE